MLAFTLSRFHILLRCDLCFYVSVDPTPAVLNAASNRYRVKHWRPVSFGTWGALADSCGGVGVFVVCGDGSGAPFLVPVVTVTIIVVVVLDTRKPVAVVLDQRHVTELQLLQLLPQLFSLLLLLLFPVKSQYLKTKTKQNTRHQCWYHQTNNFHHSFNQNNLFFPNEIKTNAWGQKNMMKFIKTRCSGEMTSNRN